MKDDKVLIIYKDKERNKVVEVWLNDKILFER